MEDPDKILKRLYDSIHQVGGNFHMFEQGVPVDLQMEYFKCAEKIRQAQPINENLYEAALNVLQNEASPKEEVKTALIILASVNQTRAYRSLEKYVQHPIHSDEDLACWAYMAFMESRMGLESELSDQRQIYISTGLGGKGDKLRFYILMFSSEMTPFLDYQREVIEKEFNYAMPQKDGEIERLTITDNYVEIVCLIPIMSNIQTIIKDIVNECNVYGGFISQTLTVTNVREFSKEEIRQIIERYGNSQASH